MTDRPRDPHEPPNPYPVPLDAPGLSAPGSQIVPFAEPPSAAVGFPAQVSPTAAPGWYPDQRSGLMRWWDGQRWTEQFGPAVSPITAYAGPRKDTAVAYLFLIFLGGLGIHRFYLGYTGSAIAMLLLYLVGVATVLLVIGFFLLGAVWIWQIVDLFLLPSMVRARNGIR